MANLKQQQSDIFGKISAINTLLERYPVLTTTDPMLTNFSLNTSIGFLLNLLEVFGVSQVDIINWLCKLLGDEDGGILEPIEYTIKGILMANIKGIFSCSINPILPDNLMKYVVDDGSGRQDPSADFPYDPNRKNCITVNLQSIDLFGLLANCPSNKKGGIFYFDAFEPSHLDVVDNKLIESPNYIPSDLYKSKDFNAFLWYVINKGNIGSNSDLQKNTWDNRNKVYVDYEDDSFVKNNFFKPVNSDFASTPRVPIYNRNGKHATDKEQYIICQYAERGSSQAYSNTLNIWLNADRYYRTRKMKFRDTEYAINKTVFEFNYDYIYSLKLFDTRTLVANIANSLLGLTSSLSASFSFEQKQVQKKIEALVENIMKESDTEISEDCYYKFDNATYQQMIDEVTKSYTGSYINPISVYNEQYDDVYDSINGLNSKIEIGGQSEILKKVIETTAYVAQNNTNKTTTTFKTNFMISSDFILDFIKQTVVQIVLQILSPKVGVLFAINSQLMGGEGELTDWENFMKNFDNMMRNIIVSVKDIIVKELYNFMMQQLKPLLELLIAKLALETIRYYKDLIMNLIINCVPSFNIGTNGVTIDNVNYADIIAATGAETEQTTPEPPC